MANYCLHCDNTFKYRSNKKFCSRYCKTRYKRKPYLKYRKTKCDSCGIEPEWIGVLDIDHIDGDKNNNQKNNLQTLCSNCHRLKTHKNRDYVNASLR